MTPEVEKCLKQVLRCTEKSSERVYFAAYDVVDKIEKLGKRKKHRDAALDALMRVALEAYRPIRGAAATALAELLTPEDTKFLPFLNKGLKNKDIDYGCVCGLFKVIGAQAYPQVVGLIVDPKRNLNSRASALAALGEYSGHPFEEGLPVFADMKASDLPIDELRTWMKAGFPPYVPEKIKLPVAGLRKLGIDLPQDYASFLLKHRSSATYENEDGCWELTTASNLLSKVNIDGKNVPSVQQLKRYAASLKASLKSDVTEDQRGKPYPLHRLAAGIAIGTGDSGEVLYLDPGDKCSVWIFHHDGGDVELAAKTFKAWLRRAEKS